MGKEGEEAGAMHGHVTLKSAGWACGPGCWDSVGGGRERWECLCVIAAILTALGHNATLATKLKYDSAPKPSREKSEPEEQSLLPATRLCQVHSDHLAWSPFYPSAKRGLGPALEL